MNILYEDNHLIAVEKPPNMPVQGDASGDADLLSAIKAYIKTKYNKPGEAFCAMVHRLDRPVGGAILFCKTSKAAARVSEQIRKGAMERQYLAVVQGEAPERGTLCDHLIKDTRANMVSVCPQGTPGAKAAKL